MLVDIKDADLTDDQKIGAILCFQWHAIDLDSGAYLLASRGRAKHGNSPRWFLIVPYDNCLFAEDGRWNREQMTRVNYLRKTYRADSLSEAVAKGQAEMPKMLSKISKLKERREKAT